MNMATKVQAEDNIMMMLWIVGGYLLIYGIIYMILGVSVTPFIMVFLALFAAEKYHRGIN